MTKIGKNIVAKGEIARFEQFLPLSLCFQNPSAAEASESVYMRESLKHFRHATNLQQPTLKTLSQK